jgi:hypothetical protein
MINRTLLIFVLTFAAATTSHADAAAAPTASPAAEVNLLAMGDWGNNGPGQRMVAATMNFYIRSSGQKFDAMLLAGDNFYVPLANVFDPRWKTMFEDLYDPSVFDFPFYPALGNHDYQQERYLVELAYSRSNSTSRWKQPARWFRVELPNEKDPLVTILVLDSNKPLLGEVEWANELKWLKSELAKPRRSKWLLCVAHHPFLSNGDHGDNGPLAKAWAPLFDRAGVGFYICGHDHDVQHLESPDHKPSLLLVGGGGATTRPMRIDQRGPFSRAGNGFAHLTFTDTIATARLVDGRDATVLHAFTRAPDGKVSVTRTTPSDKAVPRTVKSITRGGAEGDALPTTRGARLP